MLDMESAPKFSILSVKEKLTDLLFCAGGLCAADRLRHASGLDGMPDCGLALQSSYQFLGNLYSASDLVFHIHGLRPPSRSRVALTSCYGCIAVCSSI